MRSVGPPPADGELRPLFIAMHGGGGVPQHVNDSQWRVMQRYYRDQESVGGYLYLALRAPNDTWNGFYDDQISPLVERLVRQFLLFSEVDPDRVYLLGYSHGGYGAFAIGPKVPHRFAAVHSSAAAPTDGQSSPVNLRNTRFTYMIGEHDHAYGRLERCRAFDAAVAALRGERADVYPVTMEYRAGHGHGGLPDRDKIGDLADAVRDPVPAELSWELTDSVVRDFFWLAVDAPARGRRIDAVCRDNRVEVETRGPGSLALLLDARLVDFARPVTVVLGERTLELELRPSLRTLCESLLERGDPGLAYTARVALEP